MIQSNQNKLEMNRQSSSFYIQKLHSFEKRLQIIINRVKTPIEYIYPPGFQDRKQQAIRQEQIDHQWIEKYKDIVADMIEGQINKTLMYLGIQFKDTFGGQLIFWLDSILDFAQNQKYDDNLKIWHINESYKHCLHLPKGEFERNRKFKRLLKNDIQITKKLISSINELKLAQQKQAKKQNEPKKQIDSKKSKSSKPSSQKQNDSQRPLDKRENQIKKVSNEPKKEIDSKKSKQPDSKKSQFILQKVKKNYESHEESHKKIKEYLDKDQQHRKSLQFFQTDQINQPIFQLNADPEQQVSTSRTKRTIKQKEKQKNEKNLKQRMMTDYSVLTHQHKNTLLKKQIQVIQEKPLTNEQKMKEISGYFDYLKMLQNSNQFKYEPEKTLQELKDQFIQQKSPRLNQGQDIITNIAIGYSILKYINFPISYKTSPIQNFTTPFQEYENVVYCNNDEEQYSQYAADNCLDDVDSQNGSDLDTLDSEQKQLFLEQQNPYDLDQQDLQVLQKGIRKQKQFFGCKWVFDYQKRQMLQIDESHLQFVRQQRKRQGKSIDDVIITPSMKKNFFVQTIVVQLDQTQTN